MGTAGAGVAVVDPARRAGSRYTRENGLPSDDVRSLALFDGKVYAGTAGGIAVQEGERWLPVTKVGTVDLRNVVLAASPDGKELWAGSVHLTGGVVRFDGREWTFLGGEGRGLLNEVGSFAFVPGGVLMGAVSGGVYRKADGNVESLREGFPPANVFAVGERGGTYYAGTNKGLFVWRGARWEAARVPDAFSGGAVFALARADIDLFVGGRNGLLLLDRRGAARLLSGTGGVPAGPVTALAASGETVYAAVEGTVAVIREWQ